jgi:hypothetical protein
MIHADMLTVDGGIVADNAMDKVAVSILLGRTEVR